MPTESVACPMCGWWRPLNYGIDPKTLERRVVRFDKIDPTTAILYRKEVLRGAGRGSPNAVIYREDQRVLREMSDEYRDQVRRQCVKILEELDKGPSTEPHVFTPEPPPPPPPKKAKKAKPPKAAPPSKKKRAVAKPAARKAAAPAEEGPNPWMSLPIKMVIQDAKAGDQPLAIEALKNRAAEAEAYQKEQQAKKATTAAKKKTAAPAKKKAKPAAPATPRLGDLRGQELIDALKDKLRPLLDEEKKTKSVQAIEDFLNANDIDESTAEGIFELTTAIEEFGDVSREGLTPEEYGDERQAAFDAVQDAIEEIKPLEE